MFSDKRNNKSQVVERNIIANKTKIVGDIESEGDYRIDGTVEGTIKTSGRIIIGVDGIINGSVECSNADIEGTFSGKLLVSDLLSLKSTAVINGEIFINKLSVEPGATFNAICSMKSGVKELKNNEKAAEKTA